jgi:hypothetical protein
MNLLTRVGRVKKFPSRRRYPGEMPETMANVEAFKQATEEMLRQNANRTRDFRTYDRLLRATTTPACRRRS